MTKAHKQIVKGGYSINYSFLPLEKERKEEVQPIQGGSPQKGPQFIYSEGGGMGWVRVGVRSEGWGGGGRGGEGSGWR